MRSRYTYEVWISLDEIVDFLLYAASLEASVATRSKISIEHVSRHFINTVVEWLTIDEGVQDRHGAVGDTRIWVDLLEDCVESANGANINRYQSLDVV
jgi:hypothetical protein